MSFNLLPRSRVAFRWATWGLQASRSVSALTARTCTAARALPALQQCGYATAAAAKKAPAKSKPKTAATAKKTAGRTKPAAAKKPARKTTAKKSVKKPVKRVKKVAKKKTPTKPKKKVLTQRQKEMLEKKKARETIAQLKEKALTPPARLADTIMALYMKESGMGSKFAEAAKNYKSMPVSEMERLTETANANRQTNTNAYKHWLESLTPLQIKEANAARRRLNTLLKKNKYRMIHDERTVTRARTPYILFIKDHWAQAQGEEKGGVQVIPRLAKMWKNLSKDEKQRYLTSAEEDKTRYIREFKSAYGKEPVMKATA